MAPTAEKFQQIIHQNLSSKYLQKRTSNKLVPTHDAAYLIDWQKKGDKKCNFNIENK